LFKLSVTQQEHLIRMFLFFYNKIHLMKKEVVVIAVILLIVIIIAVYMFFAYGIREGMEMAPRVSPST